MVPYDNTLSNIGHISPNIFYRLEWSDVLEGQ